MGFNPFNSNNQSQMPFTKSFTNSNMYNNNMNNNNSLGGKKVLKISNKKC
jgi:hypothetical protein